MKELSIEDKAKRYDEAIEKVRSLYNDYDTISTLIDIKEELGNIFPELKESDDDGIREWLIGYFNQYIIDGMPQVFGNGLNVKYVIAWLEKQWEQKSIEWSGKIDTKHAEGKLKEMLDRKEGHAWSEEDKKEIKRIIGLLEGWLSTFKETCYAEDCKCGIVWLKSLKERYTWKPSDEQIAVLEWQIKNTHSSSWQYCVSKELLQDLKKLMEE